MVKSLWSQLIPHRIMLIYEPDRFQEDPSKRIKSCPISTGSKMKEPYRIPDFQERYRKATTKREKVQVLRDWAKTTGFLADAPDIFEDFRAEEQKAA